MWESSNAGRPPTRLNWKKTLVVCASVLHLWMCKAPHHGSCPPAKTQTNKNPCIFVGIQPLSQGSWNVFYAQQCFKIIVVNRFAVNPNWFIIGPLVGRGADSLSWRRERRCNLPHGKQGHPRRASLPLCSSPLSMTPGTWNSKGRLEARALLQVSPKQHVQSSFDLCMKELK